MPLRSLVPVRVLAVVAALAALMLASSAPALAHTELRASTPQEGATVEELTQVRLDFSGDLLDIGAELTLVDAGGSAVSLTPEFPASNAVGANVTSPPAPGAVELRWRIVAEDGHPIEGVVTFTYAPAAAPSSSPETTAAAADATPEPTTTEQSAAPAAPSPSPTASDQGVAGAEDDLPSWVLPVLALIAAGGALVAILVVRGRRS